DPSTVNGVKIEELLERLWRGDPEARDRLRSLGEEAAVAAPDLADGVAQGPRQLRKDAMFVLEGLGAAARPALPALLGQMRSDDRELATMAGDVLGAIGAEAVPVLEACLDDPDDFVREGACRALGIAGPAAGAAVTGLLKIVDRDQDNVRERAVWALGRVGDESALEPLAAVLADEGGVLGCWIADALAQYGRRARPVAELLRAELHHDDRYLALASADALRRIGIYEDAAVWSLISCLHDSTDADVRAEAAILLGDFESKATAALPALTGAERDPSPEVRAQATLAIAKIRPEYAARGA
ncbi:MAG: HEAT repeat domain-containing protein, partial [Planctomycetota bacterium]|nr:HEAT repeat domain-containing protein [Planctomycetota bacterium]